MLEYGVYVIVGGIQPSLKALVFLDKGSGGGLIKEHNNIGHKLEYDVHIGV